MFGQNKMKISPSSFIVSCCLEYVRDQLTHSCREFKELFVWVRERVNRVLGFAKILRKVCHHCCCCVIVVLLCVIIVVVVCHHCCCCVSSLLLLLLCVIIVVAIVC